MSSLKKKGRRERRGERGRQGERKEQRNEGMKEVLERWVSG